MSQRNPTSKEQNKLIDKVQNLMNIKKLNQSEISKIVNVPQPYISMFLNRRWRGSFDSLTWIRMVEHVTAWLEQETSKKVGTSTKHSAHKSGPIKASQKKEQLPAIPKLSKKNSSPSSSSTHTIRKKGKADQVFQETRSPVLKPDRGEQLNALPTKLHSSFQKLPQQNSTPQSWYCNMCTYLNKATDIECK